MIKLKKLLLLILLFAAINSNAAQIAVVSVTASGIGQNEPEAISNAVKNGIAQVNGESVASSIKIKKSVQSNSNSNTQSSRTIESELENKTKGVVKSWKKISLVNSNQSVIATVLVQVYVLQKSEQLKRTKIAVVSHQLKTDETTLYLIDGLINSLTSSRKFAVIDRKNNDAINAELNNLKNNSNNLEDQVRVGANVAPDFIAIADSKMMQDKNNQIIIEATLEVVDYSTRQVKFSEKKTSKLKTNDQANLVKQTNLLGRQLSRVIIDTLYPPLVIGAFEDEVTISQGSDFFSIGDKCVIKERRNALRDPNTKEFLGYETVDIGNAEIVYSDKRLSKAKLKTQLNLDLQKVAEKKYQIWRDGQSTSDLFKDFTKDMEQSLSTKSELIEDDY